MIDVHTLIAEQLSASESPCATRASRPNASCSCISSGNCARTFRSCSSTPSIIFPRPTPTREQIAERWGLNLVTLRAEAPAPGLWQRGHACLLRPAQGRAALRGARAPRRVVHGASARTIANARRLDRGRAVRAGVRQNAAEGQSPREMDDQRGLGLRDAARHPAAPALSAWLHQRRLRAVHDPAHRSL